MHDFNIESIDWPARHLIRAATRSVVNLCADMMLTSMAIVGEAMEERLLIQWLSIDIDCSISAECRTWESGHD